MINRWDAFSDEELAALESALAYVQTMGVHYGHRLTIEELREEAAVTRRMRMRGKLAAGSLAAPSHPSSPAPQPRPSGPAGG